MGELRFIDLFSGIGGFRLGLERNGFKCVWSNDINKYANQVYTERFGAQNHYPGDIRGVDPKDIPNNDLICGGFPCQAFSVAGKRHGFKDTRGTLFFEICRIAEHHRPSMLLLENVKGLLSHDGGRTFATILNSLEELGYWWEYQVLNSKHFGVPQNRERVFIIGHLREGSTEAVFPITEANQYFTESCGEAQGEGKRVRVANTLSVGESGRERNLIANTMSSRYYKDGSENLVSRVPLKFLGRNEKNWLKDEAYTVDSTNTGGVLINQTNPINEQDERKYHLSNIARALKTPSGNQESFVLNNAQIRRLTPVECERLQGFPDGWTEGISDTQRYKCLGNAVTVNVIEYLGELISSSFSKCKRTGM